MRSLATQVRVRQITAIVFVTFLFYQLTNWEEGMWVPISAIAIVGPFSTFLSFDKARNRFFGTIAGLLISCMLEYYLRFNPNQLPVVVVLLVAMLCWFATKSYKYMVIFVTIATCLSFTYMNMPYTSFAPLSFLIARAMGVFTGVAIFFLLQKFVFGTANAKREMLEEAFNNLTKLHKSLLEYKNSPTVINAFRISTAIFGSTRLQQEMLNDASLVFDKQHPEAVYARQVLRLSERTIRILVDDPVVDSRKLEKMLRITELKLKR